MTQRSCLAAVMACICLSATASFAEQYYRYEQKPASADDKRTTDSSVLVKEIPVQKGDTLYDLSRKFSGKGYFYPQILLFNDIKDPNRIHTGDLIKIPLGQKVSEQKADSAAPRKHIKRHSKIRVTHKKHHKKSYRSTAVSKSPRPAELSMNDLQHLGGKPETTVPMSKRTVKRDGNVSKAAIKKPGAIAENPPEITLQPEPGKADTAVSASQKIFERAVKAYRQDDCTTALELFDRFITESPSSPLAADANLYKAECYLKQSGL